MAATFEMFQKPEHEPAEYVRVDVGKDVVFVPVNDAHRRAFEEEYAAFKAGASATIESGPPSATVEAVVSEPEPEPAPEEAAPEPEEKSSIFKKLTKRGK